MAPFYSKRSVRESEPMICERVRVLTTRFHDAFLIGQVIRMDAASIALTLEVIYKYYFAQDIKLELKDDFALEWRDSLMSSAEHAKVFKHLPFLKFIMPKALLVKWLGSLLDWQSQCKELAGRSLNEFASKKDGEQTRDTDIFHAILNSDLPAEEKAVDRISDEGQILMGAAAETTGTALTKTVFYLLRTENEARLQKLRTELKSVMPEPDSIPSCLALEQLPYLVSSTNISYSFG
jgi:cytochrome P450